MANSAYYPGALKRLIENGWEMVSEGPSGAQLKKPKKMRTQTKVVLWIGVVLLVAAGLGVLFIILALLDYAMQKDQTYFLRSDNPQQPAETAAPQMSPVVKVLFWLLVFLVVIGLAARFIIDKASV